MKQARIWVIGAAVIVIAAAAISSLRGGGDDKKAAGTTATTATTPTSTAPAGAVKVVLAYSPEKEQLLQPLIAKYNAEGHEVNGQKVFVEGQNWSSGDAQAKIAKGTFRPVAWSPSSSLWGRLLNYEADKPYVAKDNPSLVRTPLVVAMWEPEAKALGWPKKQTSWAQILDLATDGTGWAKFGLPTYGKFRLGHTNPDFSTSGLAAVAAQYYAVTGKHEGLTVADVTKPAVRKKVRQIQNSVVHYGDTTLFFADQLKAHGPAYASAVAMEEVTLLDYNRTRAKGSPRLVAEYPSDGTFTSDDPYLTLAAPWVTPAQKKASDEFAKYLGTAITPELAAQYGFRSGDATMKPLAPVTAANGALPAQPARVLGLPEPEVLAKIKESWHADRKPANVELVVDVSGSMAEENKLTEAKKGLQLFLQQLSPRDRVGLIYFNNNISVGSAIKPFATNKAELQKLVANLVPDGETALYDATAAGVNNVRRLKDASRINAVVLLTDGQDTASSTKLPALLAGLEANSENAEGQTRVFTIAYGSGADQGVLEQIAHASGGKAYVGDTSEIEKVYLQISSFF